MTRASLSMIVLTFCVVCFSAVSEAHAQVPERVRVDFSFGSQYRVGSAGFLSGSFVPWPGNEFASVDDFHRLEVSTSVNVSNRLALSFALPFGIVVGRSGNDLFGVIAHDQQIAAGAGDLHFGSNLSLIGETRYSPSVSVGVDAGAPTASIRFLGAGAWQRSETASVSKSFHPRFSLFADASHSDFVKPINAATRIEPGGSLGAGINVGVSRSMMMTLHTEQVSAGRRFDGKKQVLPALQDSHLTLALTNYRAGRPTFGMVVSVGGLRTGNPVFALDYRFAVFSR